MKFWKYRNRAFTLLECLVALLVISGSMLVIVGLSKLARQEIIRSQTSPDKDWQIFSSQLRSELDGAQLDKVEADFLYVTAGADHWRFGLVSPATDFRKSNANGLGFQPMLYNVKSVQISENQGLVKIVLQMTTGGEKQFYYKFTKNVAVEASSYTP